MSFFPEQRLKRTCVASGKPRFSVAAAVGIVATEPTARIGFSSILFPAQSLHCQDLENNLPVLQLFLSDQNVFFDFFPFPYTPISIVVSTPILIKLTLPVFLVLPKNVLRQHNNKVFLLNELLEK